MQKRKRYQNTFPVLSVRLPDGSDLEGSRCNPYRHPDMKDIYTLFRTWKDADGWHSVLLGRFMTQQELVRATTDIAQHYHPLDTTNKFN